MERFWLVSSVDFDLVEGGQDFVIYWPPAVIFYTLVPTFMLVVLWLVKLNVNRLFL